MVLPRSLVELVLAQSRILARQRQSAWIGRRNQTSLAGGSEVQKFDWEVFSVKPAEECVFMTRSIVDTDIKYLGKKAQRTFQN